MSGNRPGKARDALLLISAVLLSLGGIGAFIWLFLLDLNVYWIIISPVILAVYQIPAVYFFWLWKKKKRRPAREPGREPENDTGRSAPDGI